MEALSTVDEAARSLIGSVFQHPNTLPGIVTRVKPEMIPRGPERRIYTAIMSLYKQGQEVSRTGIRREFEKNGQLTAPLETTLRECIALAPTYQNTCTPYMDIIVDAYQVDEYQHDAKAVRTGGDAVRAAQRALDRAAGTVKTQTRIADVVPKLLDIQNRIDAGESLEGHSWGLDLLDLHLRIQPGRLYCVAGLKAGGKTLFLLNTLTKNLVDGVPCFLVSLEMTANQAAKRIISNRADLNSRLFPSTHLRERRPQIETAAAEVGRLPLTIDDAAQLGVDEIAARIRSWKYSENISGGIVGLDFLQLIQHERERGVTEATALGYAAYTLARTAKDLRLAIIATVQFRNEAEGQEPHMRFIEGSGRIAQAAEAVLLLDLVSRRDGKIAKQEARQVKKQFNIHIGKNRDGEGDIRVRCMADLSTGRFYGRTN